MTESDKNTLQHTSEEQDPEILELLDRQEVESKHLGIAGRMACTFIDSPISPLLMMAALAIGFEAAKEFARTGVHPVGGTVTLDDQLALYVEHGLAHIEQIERTIDAF